jgi:mono/diheme cytochrome c family protein
MRKAIQALGAVALALALLAAAAFAGAVWLGERKMQRIVDIPVVPVAFRTDAAARTLGKYLFETRGCAQCHGAGGAGKVVIDAPNGLYVKAPDITTGPGGVVAGYSEADWVRAIRHGVNRAGHALLLMPSEDYAQMTDADLGALVAYVRALPPLAGAAASVRFPWLVKALYGVGEIRDAAQKIDHRRAPAPPVPVAATVEHGAYVAAMCAGCHGPRFAGGRIPGSPPEWPAAANLTTAPGSAMQRYATPAEFAAMMRSGKRPDGSAVSAVMPFASLGAFDDTDLAALYAFFRSLPPRAAGTR